LRIHPSTPIAHGYLDVDGRHVHGRREDDGRTLAAELRLTESATYTIHLFTDGEHTDAEPRVNRIQVLPDAPPTVQVVEPASTGTGGVVAGGAATVVVRAADDRGLGLLRIEMKAGEDGAAETLASRAAFSDAADAVLAHPLWLDPARFAPGQAVLVRGVARDRRLWDEPGLRLEPQETATPWIPLRVLDPAAQATADLAQLDTLRAALGKILQDQVAARVATIEIPRQATAADAARAAGDVRRRQVAVHQAAVTLVGTIGPADDAARQTIRRVVNKLAFGAMLDAVRRAEALEGVAPLAALAEPAAALGATQDQVIDVLRRLLGELRRDTDALLAELPRRPDSALPPDAQEKLRDLRDKLLEFLKQQKKVIEAIEDLAKTPVDDFREDDQKRLKALADQEDDWSRFLDDAHSDLSKLPEQDFSNPSLLKEMVEVQTEIQMAADALTKKTADIAVPLEQLGAEMAAEMTTNVEKWLPDTPDRERWSQEEPLTDEMKEAPLAELPGELEDIAGELMEQEEDLFDEMEDASSRWADSIDKGAGWDALDGPISNNSARGVTGNRLPNSSEIAGRSGEGRQGQASGEFVADTAVGKGGRKTPSRLTPDPFVKGQVNDLSKDPGGGATGGGKQSGFGGAGLQGPVPNRPQQPMARLASKQAELRNKAEGLDLRFRVLQYHHVDWKSLIDQMAAVEQDLRGGLYQNALRRRGVLLEGLDQVRMAPQGASLVRQDQTANLPTEIQKEILGSMQDASPAGWEGLNRQYFERLATSPPAHPRPQADVEK
jgi:hypothetical protein